jgi:hypothetical protein
VQTDSPKSCPAPYGGRARAIHLVEQILADSERILGPRPPQSAGLRNNLSGVYQSARDLAGPFPLFEQTLADSERVAGADHPNALTFRHNLAIAKHAVPVADPSLT